ncbi:MAG: carboxymuconolactone decarboxylase family protein [archaeon]
MDCAYEWEFYEPLARQEGVRDLAIETITDRRYTDDLAETEPPVLHYGRAVLQDNEVPESLFRTAKAHFGIKKLTDLTATIGYYSLLACVLNAFGVVPEENTD